MANCDRLLEDPRFARQNQSSFFSLENDFWQILGPFGSLCAWETATLARGRHSMSTPVCLALSSASGIALYSLARKLLLRWYMAVVASKKYWTLKAIGIKVLAIAWR